MPVHLTKLVSSMITFLLSFSKKMSSFILVLTLVVLMYPCWTIFTLKKIQFMKLCARLIYRNPVDLMPYQLKEALTNLFYLSMSLSLLPQDWTRAHITPVYKRGSPHLPANYRPTSLTSLVVKIMERLIFNAIVDHLIFSLVLNMDLDVAILV